MNRDSKVETCLITNIAKNNTAYKFKMLKKNISAKKDKEQRKYTKKTLIYYYALQHAISKIVNNCEYCVHKYKDDSCKKSDCQIAMLQYFLRVGQKIYYKKLRLEYIKDIFKLM